MQHSRPRTPQLLSSLTIEEAREFEMLDALPPSTATERRLGCAAMRLR